MSKPCQGKTKKGPCIGVAKPGEKFCAVCRRMVIGAIRQTYRNDGPNLRNMNTQGPKPVLGSRKAEEWYRGEMRDNDNE